MPGMQGPHSDKSKDDEGGVPSLEDASAGLSLDADPLAEDVQKALDIIKAAEEEERPLTDEEAEQLKQTFANLGTAREDLADMVKRLARRVE